MKQRIMSTWVTPLREKYILGGSFLALASALITGEFLSFVELLSEQSDADDSELCFVALLFLVIYVLGRSRKAYRMHRAQLTELSHFAEFGKLSAGLFHDLVNPLTAVALTVEHLQNHQMYQTTMHASHAVATAVRATKRMRQFMEMLKRRVEEKDLVATIDVKTEIEEIITFLHYLAGEHRVTCEIHGEESAVFDGNVLAFSQALTNLIANAIESYAADQEVTHVPVGITIRTEMSRIIIEISDHGTGMTEAVRKNIFEPFFTTKARGFGLGLAATKEIIEQDFGGTLTCVSAPGHGTTFTIILPRTPRQMQKRVMTTRSRICHSILM